MSEVSIGISPVLQQGINNLVKELKATRTAVDNTRQVIRGAMADFDQLQRLSGKKVTVTLDPEVNTSIDTSPLVSQTQQAVETMKQHLSWLWQDLYPKMLNAAADSQGSFLDYAVSSLTTYASEGLKYALNGADAVEGALNQKAGSIGAMLAYALASGADSAKETAQNIGKAFQTTLEQTESQWGSGMANIAQRVIQGGKQITDYLGSDFQNALNVAAQSPNNLFKALANSMINGINTVMSGVGTGLSSIRNFFGGGASITIPKIPLLAKGAVLPANQPFLAVVGDQKSGTNVEAPLSVIQEAVANVMEQQTGAILTGFEASVGVQREILEAILGITIGDDVLANACNRYQQKISVVKGV